jgi:hypothetical protein
MSAPHFERLAQSRACSSISATRLRTQRRSSVRMAAFAQSASDMVVSHAHRMPAYPVPHSSAARVFARGLCASGYFSN